MSSHRPINTARPVGQWLTAVAACFGLLMPAVGQDDAQGASSMNPSPSVSMPSMAAMQQAVLTQDYTVEQLRRFRDEYGAVVTVRERLRVDANGTARPDFQISFLGVEGEPALSPLSLKWQQTYSRFGSLFFRHGSFQVRDLAKAVNNYSLHDFGQVIRAGRTARRMVVFPTSVDKAIWVVDIDSVTNIPLLIAEFDNQLKLRANIEAVSFATSVQTFTPTQPLASVTVMTDYAAADAFLGSPMGLIDPNVMVTPDYALDNIEVHVDPINGRQKLVMSYCDGIDQFMVVQTVGSLNPFAGLPSAAGGAHTIGRFRDPAISALVFWDDQVSFHVAGRGSLQRLDEVARRIYLQALSN